MSSTASPKSRNPASLRTAGDGSSAISSFLKALNDETFSDVTFVMDDQQEFHCHRCILAARSDAFRAMLYGDHDEGKNKRVEVKDMDSNHFYTILEWAYCGQVTMSAADVLGVLKLANFYLFTDLEKHCRDLALGFIDTNNAFILLNSAVENGEEEIVAKCLEFIRRYCAEAIETTSWLQLCSAGVQDVLAQQQLDVSEFVLFDRTVEWIKQNATDDSHRTALLTSFLPRIRLSQLTIQELLNDVKPIVNQYSVQQKEYVEALEYKLSPEHFRVAKTVDRLCPRIPSIHQRIVQNISRKFLNGWKCVCEIDSGSQLPGGVLQTINLHSTTYIAVGECVGQNITLMAVGSVEMATRKSRSHTPTPIQDGAIYWFNGTTGIQTVFGFSPTSDQRVTFDVTPSERNMKMMWQVNDESSSGSDGGNKAATTGTGEPQAIGSTRFVYVK